MERNHSGNGFTFIELLVTIAVIAILLGVAIPSFNTIINKTSISIEANQLLSAINFARSESVKRNGNVSLCPSGDGASCNRDLGWRDGWIVFTDTGTIGQLDAGEDTVLRVGTATDDGYLIYSTKHRDWFGYRADGTSVGNSGAGNVSFIICKPGADASVAKKIVISVPGRVRVQQGRGSSACQDPEA